MKSARKPKKGYKTTKWLFGKEIEIPEELEILHLTNKQIMHLSSGNSIKNIELNDNYPVFGSNGIIGYAELSNEDDAILIGRVGAAGSINYIEEKVWVTDNVLVCKVGEKIDKKILLLRT